MHTAQPYKSTKWQPLTWDMWFYPECALDGCCVPRLRGGCAVLQAAGRITESRTPCGKDTSITASSPSSVGTGNLGVCGLWVFVNIIGRWCVKPAVLVRSLKATSQTKLKADRPSTSFQPWTVEQEYWCWSEEDIFLIQVMRNTIY